MDLLIVYPENQEQLIALKAVMKAMKVSFQQKSDVYPYHVIDELKASIKQADEGHLLLYTSIRDLLKSE